MMYIKRHLETTIEKLSGCCKVLLVTGPRQVGKTTLFKIWCESAEGIFYRYRPGCLSAALE